MISLEGPPRNLGCILPCEKCTGNTPLLIRDGNPE